MDTTIERDETIIGSQRPILRHMYRRPPGAVRGATALCGYVKTDDGGERYRRKNVDPDVCAVCLGVAGELKP
jgi:hypothetical protein